MAIPKIIHSCWFGGSSKSEIGLQCLASWKQFCPDYEFKEWNEHNSKPYWNSFYKDAIRNKKYAFAADCIRVQVLAEFGGIYLDTDMLLLKPLDQLLAFNFFVGDEVPERPNFAIFGGIAKHRFFNDMTAFYQNERYNRYSPPVITHTFKGLVNTQALQENEVIFSPEYFYPLPYQDSNKPYNDYITANTVAVHLWDHSWRKTIKQSPIWLVKQLFKVSSDYLIYGYPKVYAKRYLKEFGRKLYHKITAKQSN